MFTRERVLTCTYTRAHTQASLGDTSGGLCVAKAFPWHAACRSVPLLAICVAGFSASWGFYLLLASMPDFMSHVLHVNIASSGLALGFMGGAGACGVCVQCSCPW